MAWLIGGVLALVIVVVGGFCVVHDDGGLSASRGRARLCRCWRTRPAGAWRCGGVHFSLWHLAIEVDGLVIHGLEGPGEAPYLSADKILVRVKITNFFAHATGAGLASHVGLNLLRVEHPQFHLIIDKDGKTNQPVPKHPTTSTEPVQDTLLDLRREEAELVNGVALLNDRAIPFDLAARDLNAEVHYLQRDRPLWNRGRPERSADEDGQAAGGAVEAASGGGAWARHGAAEEARVRFGQGVGAARDGDAEPLCAAGVAGRGRMGRWS